MVKAGPSCEEGAGEKPAPSKVCVRGAAGRPGALPFLRIPMYFQTNRKPARVIKIIVLKVELI